MVCLHPRPDLGIPVSWRPSHLGEGGARCRRRIHRTRRSSGGGWSSWCGPGEARGSLAGEYEPSEQAIRNWVRQAERDEEKRSDGLTTVEREELRQLKREVRTLREERTILAKAAAWFARENGKIPSGSSNS